MDTIIITKRLIGLLQIMNFLGLLALAKPVVGYFARPGLSFDKPRR
jgi:hypothetical protein